MSSPQYQISYLELQISPPLVLVCLLQSRDVEALSSFMQVLRETFPEIFCELRGCALHACGICAKEAVSQGKHELFPKVKLGRSKARGPVDCCAGSECHFC
ncbi:hypothetical protein IscW_ISCW021185 [Ixodes scapularis]|uniref:Uncharacterized protein n=1 Tax=Ixodes scapularis TaxID=6945 RepID=B7Q8W0_IXOSC|nr:hypothetical protein IscW_ISCW021185 [Ixodes scapularis]|eukprot:XP_002405445.1 hypothetical protein IscW_ISCW021185 [Ixodes scapularis]